MDKPIPADSDAGDKDRDDSPGLTPEAASQYWQVQLHLAERAVKAWHDHGLRIELMYRNQRDEVMRTKRSIKRFAILYSNTETLKTAFYARTPKPDVRRRWNDRNPVARTAADIIERALAYCADNTSHDRAYRGGVHDLCLPGRGVAWVLYEAETGQVPSLDPMTGQPAIGPDGQPMLEERVTKQTVREEHVYWRDFLWSPCRSWAQVTWIARRHKMTREDLRKNFEAGDDVPLNWVPDLDQRTERELPDSAKRAEVWEIWCKEKKARYWIVKGYKSALRIDPDPYELESFFPIAEPLSAVLGTDTYTPEPYYREYEDQAEDLNELTGRISHLIKALKRRGIYDASITELRRLAKAQDNEFLPVDGAKYSALVQNGGLANAYQVEDVEPIAKVLVSLYEQRDRLIQSIYEVTGISDIIRGQSDPNETATAQNIKAQFGSMRMKDAQREVQRWVRDTYRIKAELIAQNFTPENLAAITGMNPQDQTFMAAIQILQSDDRRGYQIDIETDSTIFEDQENEKAQRIELIQGLTQYMAAALPVVQAQPAMAKLVFEVMAFGIRGFKAGRSLEDVIDETEQQVLGMIQQQMSQPPPPDPAMMKVDAEMKRDEQSHQMDMQSKQFDMQAKVMDLQHKQQSNALDVQKQAAMAAIQGQGNGPQARSTPLQ